MRNEGILWKIDLDQVVGNYKDDLDGKVLTATVYK
jgi:hypothetical protein